jgi:hypothetical protein
MIGSDEDFAANEELTRWLEDSGRRKAIRFTGATASLAVEGRRPRLADALRRQLLLGVLALSGVQYFYVDVMGQILSLRSIIFFVLTN